MCAVGIMMYLLFILARNNQISFGYKSVLNAVRNIDKIGNQSIL